MSAMPLRVRELRDYPLIPDDEMLFAYQLAMGFTIARHTGRLCELVEERMRGDMAEGLLAATVGLVDRNGRLTR